MSRGERRIVLTARQRRQVEQLLASKEAVPRTRVRGQVLLLSDRGWKREDITAAGGASRATIGRVRRRFRKRGLEAALMEDERSGAPAKISASDEQRIVALVCSAPPPGRSRWTVRLLAEEAVKRKLVKEIGRERLRVILRDHELKPWREKMWCIPALTPEFITRMEDVLNLYERPYDPRQPVVCLDERPTPLHADARPPVVQRDGSRHRDSEYVRQGVANVFAVVEPKAGRHLTRATANRKNPAVARILRTVEQAYPNADTIHLVVDNASTHTPKALTDTFGLDEGRRIWRRFTVHYTPKHGSWLNQAEIELSIFVRQCLGSRRIDALPVLRSQTAAWTRRANRNRMTIDWKFTTRDARKKLRYRALRTSRSED